MALPASPSLFMFYAQSILQKANHGSRETELRRFRSLFGVSPSTCAHVWQAMRNEIPPGGRPIHLLWALLFLKVYSTENVNSLISGADEKTFRKWTWIFVELIADLEVVRNCISIRLPYYYGVS